MQKSISVMGQNRFQKGNWRGLLSLILKIVIVKEANKYWDDRGWSFWLVLGNVRSKIIQRFCGCLYSIISSHPLSPINILLVSKISETVSYKPVCCKRPSFVSLALALYPVLHLVPVMNTCTDISSQQIDFVTNDPIIDFVVSWVNPKSQIWYGGYVSELSVPYWHSSCDSSH